jgi:1-aminocyclopropane-1-carboxylate deaminase
MLAGLTAVHEPHLLLPSPLDAVEDDRLAAHGIRLLLKRDDLVHPDLPGNKWRKLLPNLVAARDQGHTTLLTFGGAYSNHLRAVAAAGWHFGFDTVGVVRGEEHDPLNEVLAAAAGFGMRLTYVDRKTYREKTGPALLDRLRARFGDCYILPEGGSNALAARGCAGLPREISEPFDVICCAVGTGGTLAGIAGGLRDGRQALGFAVLKGGGFLNGDVAALQKAAFGRVLPNWSIETGFHGGGYARCPPGLDAFIDDFARRHGPRLNRVYEAKALLGLFTLVEQRRFAPGTTIVAVLAG